MARMNANQNVCTSALTQVPLLARSGPSERNLGTTASCPSRDLGPQIGVLGTCQRQCCAECTAAPARYASGVGRRSLVSGNDVLLPIVLPGSNGGRSLSEGLDMASTRVVVVGPAVRQTYFGDCGDTPPDCIHGFVACVAHNSDCALPAFCVSPVAVCAGKLVDRSGPGHRHGHADHAVRHDWHRSRRHLHTGPSWRS